MPNIPITSYHHHHALLLSTDVILFFCMHIRATFHSKTMLCFFSILTTSLHLNFTIHMGIKCVATQFNSQAYCLYRYLLQTHIKEIYEFMLLTSRSTLGWLNVNSATSYSSNPAHHNRTLESY